jgi:hypothetical protein
MCKVMHIQNILINWEHAAFRSMHITRSNTHAQAGINVVPPHIAASNTQSWGVAMEHKRSQPIKRQATIVPKSRMRKIVNKVGCLIIQAWVPWRVRYVIQARIFRLRKITCYKNRHSILTQVKRLLSSKSKLTEKYFFCCKSIF